MPAEDKWVMPKWAEPFRGMIANTGGNPIEELLNDKHTNMQNNAIRTILKISVEAQMALLARLHEKNLLCAVD